MFEESTKASLNELQGVHKYIDEFLNRHSTKLFSYVQKGQRAFKSSDSRLHCNVHQISKDV